MVWTEYTIFNRMKVVKSVKEQLSYNPNQLSKFAALLSIKLHSFHNRPLDHVCKSKLLNPVSVLQNTEETEESIAILKKVKLPLHPDRTKNWDSLRTLACILSNANYNDHILDVGSAPYSVILKWLAILGYKNLHGCNILLSSDYKVGPISYSKQNLESTKFSSCSFDFATALSVIEHGVKVDKYLKEMFRLLKPGGMLLTSTDYWEEFIDTNGIYPYGHEFGQMRIFTRCDIEDLFELAKEIGFLFPSNHDLSCKDKVIRWTRTGKSFTYIFFRLIKPKNQKVAI